MMAPFASAGATLFVVSVLTSEIRAQTPQAIHPWTTGCTSSGCFLEWFCVQSADLCVQCPNNEGTTVEDCRNSFVLVEGNGTMTMNGSVTYHTNETMWQLDVDNCISDCVKPTEGEFCTAELECSTGNFFCNYDVASTDTLEDEVTREGVCQPCKADIQECFNDPNVTSSFSMEECILCDVGVCIPLHYSVTTEMETGVVVASNALRGAPKAVGQGPLVECSNLLHREEFTCVENGNELPPSETRQDGNVCLVYDYTRTSHFATVVNKCAALGGVGVALFQRRTDIPNNETWFGSLSYLPTTIPSVVLSYDDGKRWESELLGTMVRVNTTDVGKVCTKKQFCSDEIPCLGSSEGQYCDYKWGGGNGGNGFCRTCPTNEDGDLDPKQCFFNVGDDTGKAMGQKGVESCASTCASSLVFPTCKFCPQDVSGFEFGLETENAEKCRFCPENDVLYPDKEFSLFGGGIKCWQVQKFFDSVDINAEARNCQLARMMNYVCGCAGQGYAGASTTTKRRVLAWLPRIMALLSVAGSSFIIWDNVKTPSKRKSIVNRLLIGLSAFDLMGSLAYTFTTLPIPEDYEFGPIHGARGNEASCLTQGFFIQMGTISAYLNVSLAMYYLLVVHYGWTDRRVEKIEWMLFLVPILIGFAFAFAGIPFYDSLGLWCNNAARYWPDIPVALAIAFATVIMGRLSWGVYTKDKASAKYRGGAGFEASTKQRQTTEGTRQLEPDESNRQVLREAARPTGPTLSGRVFWQSFFYLMAFYLTWPAYLGLQYAWAGGRSFTNYSHILTAATLVPLQGFWNMIVYVRPRYAQKTLSSLRNSLARATRNSSMRRSSKFGRDVSGTASSATHNKGSKVEVVSAALPCVSEEEEPEKPRHDEDDP